MARIEKTVFISYRRKDISWALAVYQYLTGRNYDVFFDYTSIPSGDFEQIIVSNIKARAHFILILTPTALDRCSNPGDWLRREIETAIDEKRNIIPLFFDGFNFGSPSVAEKLTGKLSTINRYNGLDIPSGYFTEAMERLRSRYLNVPLNAVIHPVSTEVRKVVKEEKVAVDKALVQKKEDINELVKPAEEKSVRPKQTRLKRATVFPLPLGRGARVRALRPYGIGAGILLVAALAIAGINSLIQNKGENKILTPTQTREFVVENTLTPTRPVATDTATIPPFTPTPELGIGSTMISPKDGMILLYVPAGEFTMGFSAEQALTECQKYRSDCQLSWFKSVEPPHQVNLDSFWIDQTEVTNSMFEKFVQDTGYITSAQEAGLSYVLDVEEFVAGADWGHPLGPNSGISKKMTHPVVHVSWKDSVAYCTWANRRLPTEAEWEKAASWNSLIRKKYIYPWDKWIDCSLANYGGCLGHTAPVGSYPSGASPYTALDMAGNVFEWVEDWFSESYYKSSPIFNPLGPDSGTYRVMRGGSWSYYAIGAQTTFRIGGVPDSGSNYLGFRCARSE